MRLFETSTGFIFSIGFDPWARVRDPHLIAWCDPLTKEWETRLDNIAGTMRITNHTLNPAFIRETKEGTVVMYQDGVCIEATYAGQPFGWTFALLTSDTEREPHKNSVAIERRE
jgi:hypothetical protein